MQFLPQCDNVAIMNEGEMVYFGPWNENAQQLLNQYLPVSHLLAAGGAAEQPKGDKSTKKVVPKRKASTRQPSFKKKEPKVQPHAMAKSLSSCLFGYGEVYMLVKCAMHCGPGLPRRRESEHDP
jgi:ATP-binding cassette subfamily C (CFTR/MRP) protein 1